MAQCVRFGLAIPDAIKNKPEVLDGLDIYFQAFSDLNGDRTNGPIQWSSMANYATFYGFDEEQTEDLFYHVRAMDTAFLNHCNK